MMEIGALGDAYTVLSTDAAIQFSDMGINALRQRRSLGVERLRRQSRLLNHVDMHVAIAEMAKQQGSQLASFLTQLLHSVEKSG